MHRDPAVLGQNAYTMTALDRAKLWMIGPASYGP
jgi:hypothetical protein